MSDSKKKSDERKAKFVTSSQIPIKSHYSKEDLPKDFNLENPGEYPFTRGVQDNMYRGRLWTMRQYAGFGSAKESNKRYKHLLAQGTSGLSVAFDLPTQMGYDSDHIMATGEVGKVGVSISTIEDMELLFKDLPLDQISTSMTINSTAGILLAFYIAVAEKNGVSPAALRGTIQNDLLKEYIARGTYIFPPKPSLRIISDIFGYCSKEVPQWNTISISGYHIREAGATAAQELAFTLANAITYVQSAIDAGLDVDVFTERISFFFNVQNQFFEEIAKFRAARRMWAHILKTRFNVKNSKSLRLRFHSQTAGVSLTAQQPENNIIRVTHQALASVLGGTQSLHTNSMDEALGLPTEKAATIALRTQQILAEETGVADVVDPLAGSYYVESLTTDLEKLAYQYIERIESLGGVVSCIESGWLQNEIHQSAYRYQKAVESGEEIIVGVNKYISDSGAPPDVLKIQQKAIDDQLKRLKRFKKERKQEIVRQYIDKIKATARSNDNLMPVFVEAVKNKVTLGEISDSLRDVFGRYKESSTF